MHTCLHARLNRASTLDRNSHLLSSARQCAVLLAQLGVSMGEVRDGPERRPDAQLEMHAVAEPVDRVVFPRKPPDASLKLGADDAGSKQERQEQASAAAALLVLSGTCRVPVPELLHVPRP